MLPIFVVTDQLADVFAAGTITSPGDLLVDELLQVGHDHVPSLANMRFGARFSAPSTLCCNKKERQAIKIPVVIALLRFCCAFIGHGVRFQST